MLLSGEVTEKVGFICRSLIERFSPECIIVFGEKSEYQSDEVYDIDICVIAEFDDRTESLRSAYRNIESDIPFDLFLYNPSEWCEMSVNSGTFAERIKRKGRIVYEKDMEKKL